MVWKNASAVGGGSVGASLLSGNIFHCPLVAQGHSRSVWRASLEENASGNLFVSALTVEPVTNRFFKQCSAWMVHWQTMGLLADHDGLLWGFRCDTRNPTSIRRAQLLLLLLLLFWHSVKSLNAQEERLATSPYR